jgi:adenosylhomocysteine nucleosidase
MPSELRPLQKALSLRRTTDDDRSFHTGTFAGRDVVATLTGIGPERAAQRAEELLARYDVEHLVVIGVAGAMGADVAVGDVVIPEVVVDLADGAEFRPSPGEATPTSGRLVTCAEYITDTEVLSRIRSEGATAIDMETAAIARVCEAQGCEWSVFRGISDDAFDPAIDDAVAGLARPDGTPDLAAVTRYVAGNPTRIRLLARLGRDLKAATNGAVAAALRAIEARGSRPR